MDGGLFSDPHHSSSFTGQHFTKEFKVHLVCRQTATPDIQKMWTLRPCHKSAAVWHLSSFKHGWPKKISPNNRPTDVKQTSTSLTFAVLHHLLKNLWTLAATSAIFTSLSVWSCGQPRLESVPGDEPSFCYKKPPGSVHEGQFVCLTLLTKKRSCTSTFPSHWELQSLTPLHRRE